MAEKITVLRSSEDQFGNLARTVLLWFPISPVIQDSRGNTIKIQTRADIRDPAILLYLTTADLDALDAGQAGYEIASIQQTNGETNTAFRTRALAYHTVRAADWVAARRNEYAISGLAVSA